MRASLYEALGIAPTASDEEVRAALRRLIRKYYAKTRDGQGNVEEALRFINHASRILSDPERRARYDNELALSAGTRRAADRACRHQRGRRGRRADRRRADRRATPPSARIAREADAEDAGAARGASTIRA